MQSLAVKYRPKDFNEVVFQQSVIKILTNQIQTNQLRNAYLFAGSSGCGKTTLARIFANRLNNTENTYIEIDAASNSGVDNVRAIISSAKERALDCKYKVFIVDEAHMITIQGWNAFLKCIEETPPYTIIIFCTTDPQKIPLTILNRVQRFNINKIPSDLIKERLSYICKREEFIHYEEAVDYISKISNGGMRDAISTLEKCACFSKDLSINNILTVLGEYSYDSLFTLINALIDGKEDVVLNTVNDFHVKGNDLRHFIDIFISFCLDISKYILFKNCDSIKIPVSMEDKIKASINFDNASQYYMYIINNLLDLKNMLKNDNDMKSTIEIIFLKICRML